MVTWQLKRLSGFGVLFFSGPQAIQGPYEIQVGEENGTPRISGHFRAKLTILKRMIDTPKAALRLEDGQSVKVQITSGLVSGRVDFDVVGDKSIQICRDL
jgi:hypothetical protein